MSFKLHLIIVSCIIIAVYLAWQLMSLSAPAPAPAGSTIAAHNITITHATWGLNCRNNMPVDTDPTEHDAFVNKHGSNDKLREDNVLGPVSLLCNGKPECDVSADDKTLGEDPAPDCNNKLLTVEYRCFSYDRPWIIKSSSGSISLHCDAPAK